jgi:hypothetical protein
MAEDIGDVRRFGGVVRDYIYCWKNGTEVMAVRSLGCGQRLWLRRLLGSDPPSCLYSTGRLVGRAEGKVMGHEEVKVIGK